VEKRKILSLSGIGLRPFSIQAHTKSEILKRFMSGNKYRDNV
jgi:hypothetical protein